MPGSCEAGFDGEPLDIALGEEGTPGRDGRIEYSFETDAATPHAGSGEDASYVPRVIGNIAAGQPLAVLVPAGTRKTGVERDRFACRGTAGKERTARSRSANEAE